MIGRTLCIKSIPWREIRGNAEMKVNKGIRVKEGCCGEALHQEIPDWQDQRRAGIQGGLLEGIRRCNNDWCSHVTIVF